MFNTISVINLLTSACVAMFKISFIDNILIDYVKLSISIQANIEYKFKKSKKDRNDPESIQSGTTPVLGY